MTCKEVPRPGICKRHPQIPWPRPAFRPRNPCPRPVPHDLPLRPFTSPPRSPSWLIAGCTEPVPTAGAGPGGRTLPPGLAVGGRVLRRGVAAAGPRQRSPPDPGGKSSPRPRWRCTPRAARATHQGALGQIVATQSVVQVEADHVAGGQGEVLSHGCAGSTGERLGRRESASSRRSERCGTLRDGTGRDRGGVGLRPPPGRSASASSASRARERRPRPRFSPPLARLASPRRPRRFGALRPADLRRPAPGAPPPPTPAPQSRRRG